MLGTTLISKAILPLVKQKKQIQNQPSKLYLFFLKNATLLDANHFAAFFVSCVWLPAHLSNGFQGLPAPLLG